MKATAVVPAYNEAGRIGAVIECLIHCACIDEIVVVSDGSTDGTADVASSYPHVNVVRLETNRGKGGAMFAGARATQSEIIVFLDADLIGLTSAHVDALVTPVSNGEADMSIGVFRGGRRCTDWAQKITPYISGQRALLRDTFLSVSGLEDARYGVEVSLGRFARIRGLKIVMVPFPGVTHPMKEEKLGFARGVISRAKMYWEIVKLLMFTSEPANRIREKLHPARDESSGNG